MNCVDGRHLQPRLEADLGADRPAPTPRCCTAIGERRAAAAKGLVSSTTRGAWAARPATASRSDPSTAGLPVVARAFVNNLPFTCGLTIQYERRRTDRRAHAPQRQRLRPRQALSLGAGDPVADAKPMHRTPHRRRCALPPLFPVRAGGRLGARRRGAAVRLARNDPASPLRHYRGRRRHRRGDRHPRGVPAGFRVSTSPPALLAPARGPLRLTDYEKIFCADRSAAEDIFADARRRRAAGCMVVRPTSTRLHVLLPTPVTNWRSPISFIPGARLSGGRCGALGSGRMATTTSPEPRNPEQPYRRAPRPA